jgi:uncharacterized protein YeaO (DUF488 family)
MSARVPAAHIKTKRVYDEPSSGDGVRILVDRLWPRGLSKEGAAISHWLRDLAPSDALRQWFDHEPARWPGFRKRYAVELADQREALREVRDLARRRAVTLLYAAHDDVHNNAVALRNILLRRY